jgi:acyl-coenzyme A synthetase/AMP-(fatty) acid ligase
MAAGADGRPRCATAARLRFIRSSGAALPSAIHQTLESAFGVPVLDAYVVTEACGQAALQLPSSPRGKLRPHDGVSVAILDPGGRTVEAGAMGEVALAGPTVALGYDGDPEATRKFFIGGWFRTGDFGYLDADGCLTLAGTTENTEPPNDCR